MASSTSASSVSNSTNTAQDDTFQLYDLRVEVVCPSGERIMCGAKEGDHFTLEGEMLYLPPGQGISIYSLGQYATISSFLYCPHDLSQSSRCGPAPPRCEATYDGEERLDVNGRGSRMP